MKTAMDPSIRRLLEFLDGSWVQKCEHPDPKEERAEIYRALMGYHRRMSADPINHDKYLLLVVALDFISVSQLVESSIMKYPKMMIFETDMEKMHECMYEVIRLLNLCIRKSKKSEYSFDLEMACLDLECLAMDLFTLKMERANSVYMSMVTCASTTIHADIWQIKAFLYHQET